MTRFQKILIFLMTIIVIQSLAITAIVIKTIIPQTVDDIQMVKDMPVPDYSFYTVGILLDRVVENPLLPFLEDSKINLKWHQFNAGRGITVVEASGEVQDEKLRNLISENLSKKLNISPEEIMDYSFRIQFIRNYSSETENILSNIFPSIFVNEEEGYHYTISFQTFGALKNQDNQYHDVLSSLSEYLFEAY